MDQKKKVEILDFVTIALPGVLVLLVTAFGVLFRARGPKGWFVGTALVGVFFLGLWIRVRMLRSRA